MILDAPKESRYASEGVSRPARTRPIAAPSSHPPSRLPRRTAAHQHAPAQTDAPSHVRPHTLESTRELILSGRTEEALLAHTEVLFSILSLLTAQNQRDAELETQSIQSTLPPYSRPSTPPPTTPTTTPTAAQVWTLLGQSSLVRPSPPAPQDGSSSPTPSASSSLPSPPTSPVPPLSGRTTPTPSRPYSQSSASSLASSSPMTLEDAPVNQMVRNHFASLGVRVLSRVQVQMLEALKSPSPGQSVIVEGGACEGKSIGLLMGLLSHVRHPSPTPSSPQILLLTPGADSAASTRDLLPSDSRAIKSLTLHGPDPREDARNLSYFQPNVIIGTVQRCMELASGGIKGKGRAGSLDLSGVRWVGVEAGVWADSAARETWHKMVDCGIGGLRTGVRYCVLGGRQPTPNLELYLNPLMNARRNTLTITGQSDLEFLRSPAVKHFHVSTSTPLASLLSIYKSILLRCPAIIFCSSPASVRDLSTLITFHRAESHTLHPDDTPANKSVLLPSANAHVHGTKTTVPLLSTTFTGHTLDRVSAVVNWDGTISAQDYLERGSKLDAHGAGRRLIFTFSSTPEQETAFLDAMGELEIELSDPKEMLQTSSLTTTSAF